MIFFVSSKDMDPMTVLFLCLLRTDIMAGKHCILGDGKTFDKQHEESINLRIVTRV